MGTDTAPATAAPADERAAAQTVLAFDDNRLASALFGQYGQNLALIERRLGVVADSRGNHVTIEGPRGSCEQARHVLEQLYEQLKRGGELASGDAVVTTYACMRITWQRFEQLLQLKGEYFLKTQNMGGKALNHPGRGGPPIRPRVVTIVGCAVTQIEGHKPQNGVLACVRLEIRPPKRIAPAVRVRQSSLRRPGSSPPLPRLVRSEPALGRL